MSICSSETQCPLYSAASLGQHVIGPHANPPSHIILTPGRPAMFRGPYLIVSTMQAGTTFIFKVFGMTVPITNRNQTHKSSLSVLGPPYHHRHNIFCVATQIFCLIIPSLGETSKFNLCGASFLHGLTKSNYIVCDFCRSLIEQSWVSI